jgi:CubicO group peptidase (beta-lactamase class C family)
LQNRQLHRHCIFCALTFAIFTLVLFNTQTIASAAASAANCRPASTPEKQGMDSKKLADMMAYIKKEALNIDSILIVRNGQMVLDANFYPFTGDRIHNLFSCTKSVLSALVGIAIDKGYISSVTQPVTDFFADHEIADLNALKKSITLENLLTMTSGLECRDSYRYKWAGLTEMRKCGDWAQHVLDLPMDEPAGKRFEYCNGNSQLISTIIQITTNMTTLDFARKYLFDPLDITAVDWKASPKGIEQGYAGLWLRPHDLAKLGQLYLNKGKWDGKQIISPEWIDVSTRGQVDAHGFKHYGYHWWVDSIGSRWFHASDYFIAVGSNGQCLFVMPDENIVIVFTGNMKEKKSVMINMNLILDYIVPALSAPKELPRNDKALGRLNAKIKEAAQPVARIWNSKEEGFAQDGLFQRTSLPQFQFKYPPMSHKAAIKYKNQIMRMYFDVDSFSASVIDIPEDTGLEEFGPEYYLQNGFLEKPSNIKVVGNDKILLAGGTAAYKTEISWKWNNTLPITTYLVSAYKDGKCIYVDAHAWKHHEILESIVRSLSFE